MALARSGDARLARATASDVIGRGTVDAFLRGTDAGVLYGRWICERRSAACPLAPEPPPRRDAANTVPLGEPNTVPLGPVSGQSLTPMPVTTTIWSATMTVKDNLGGGAGTGCRNESTDPTKRCSNAATLTDDIFVFDGTRYTILKVVYSGGQLEVKFDKVLPASKGTWKLHVGSASNLIVMSRSGNVYTCNLALPAVCQAASLSLTWPMRPSSATRARRAPRPSGPRA